MCWAFTCYLPVYVLSVLTALGSGWWVHPWGWGGSQAQERFRDLSNITELVCVGARIRALLTGSDSEPGPFYDELLQHFKKYCCCRSLPCGTTRKSFRMFLWFISHHQFWGLPQVGVRCWECGPDVSTALSWPPPLGTKCLRLE